jgi:hypothetical protein
MFRSWGGRAAVALAAGFIVLHLPYLPASLEDLDSINFALGLRRFDVANHQPHPPGYPLFIAAGKVVRTLVPSDARALASIGVAAAGLAILALVILFRRLDETDGAGSLAIPATLLAVTSPLYWLTAARPLSDSTGLAAALAVQALIVSVRSTAGLMAASFLAAFATGFRSQVAWLTVPLLVWRAWDVHASGLRAQRIRLALRAFIVGGLAWAVPLVLITGGPAAYWHAVFDQGAEDLTGIQMLWTTPTPRELASALYYAFIAPWAVAWVAAIVLAAALVGAFRLFRGGRPVLLTLAVAFAPYLAFDLLFQETFTTRYALPLVVPVAYLAARGLSVAGAVPGLGLTVCLAAFNAHIGGTSLAAYASEKAPVFRIIADMQAASAERGAPSPVIAMHRPAERPITWIGDALVPLARRLPAPPKHEWLELVKYWNGGGDSVVWFVADPRRTDLALIDHPKHPIRSYSWPLPYPILLGGVRPDAADWYSIREPGWYLGEGWSLTPETAGLAQSDGRGPGRAPVQGWITRRTEAMTLVLGGRLLVPRAPPAHVRVAIDGRVIDEWAVAPGFFLRFVHLDAGTLQGQGSHALLTVASDHEKLAVEQFDAQSADQVVFGFGDGWHEAEFNPMTGLTWHWMSERAWLRVHAAGHPLTLTLRGEGPEKYFSRPSRVVVRAGGQVVAQQVVSSDFSIETRIPADLVRDDESAVTIETDQTFAPAERSWRSRDQRRLGLRVFACEVRPAS